MLDESGERGLEIVRGADAGDGTEGGLHLVLRSSNLS